MGHAFSSSDLSKHLEAAGIPYPPECADVEVLMPADGIMQIRFTINVTTDMLPKIAKALQAYHDDRAAEEAFRTRPCAECGHAWNWHGVWANGTVYCVDICPCPGFKEKE
jgi:hypothetical protein